MINTRAVIRITLPHTQRPVGLGRSSADGSSGFGVGFGAGSRAGSVIVSGSGVERGLGSGSRGGLGRDNGFGLGSSSGFGSGDGLGEGEGLEGIPNVRNASQERVSALTCIPYLTSACLAFVQLKNLSPFFGLKF